VAGATPTEQEREVARRVARLIAAVRDLLRGDFTLRRHFKEELEEAVACALTGPDPRRPGIAEFALTSLERSLLGPFRKGSMSRADAIAMQRNLAAPAMTDEQRVFMTELEQQERLIKSLFKAEEKRPDFLELMDRLRFATEIGLFDVPSDVRLARFAVAGIVQDAMRERGQKARAQYLDRLGWAYGKTWLRTALALAAYWGLQLAWPKGVYFAQELHISGTVLLLLGIALAALFGGAWLSAVARLQPDSPEVLDGIFTNTFTSPLRSVFVLGFGLLALLLLYKKAIVFSFGPDAQAVFTSADVLKTLSATILTGAFLGLGEAALPNAVIQRSSGLVSSLGAKAPPK